MHIATEHPPKVLVIEDDAFAAQMVREALAADYAVHWAATCAEAQAMLQQHSFDLILLDIELPDGNGVELLTHLSQPEDRLVPTIVMTSVPDNTVKLAAWRNGCFDFLRKPFTPAELHQRLLVHNHLRMAIYNRNISKPQMLRSYRAMLHFVLERNQLQTNADLA